MDPIPPTYSFSPAGKPAQAPRPAPSVATPEARIGQAVDQVDVQSRPKSALERLIAATVDKATIADTPVIPRPAAPSGAIELYAHPADKNAAATGVTLGRRIDVSG